MACAKEKGSCSYAFTREQTAFLISLYEQQAVLYEVGNENFKNKTRRQTALKKIQEEFNEKFVLSNVTLEDIRKKINNLRTQFFSEVNKMKKSLVSGTGTDDIYIPTLWCYEQLSFLNTSNPVRESESNLVMSKNNLNENQSCQEVLFEGTIEEFNSLPLDEAVESQAGSQMTSPLCSPLDIRPPSAASNKSNESQLLTRPSKKRKQAEGQSKAVVLMEKATELLSQTNEPVHPPGPLDVIDAFLVSLGAELRQIKSTTRCRNLRQNILKLTYETQQQEDLEHESS